jgi:DNA-directed RNA polymerase specialized sigma24 family protein
MLRGLTHDEIAEALDIGPTTVTRNWASAKAWL